MKHTRPALFAAIALIAYGFPSPAVADAGEGVEVSPLDLHTKPLLAPGEVLISQSWDYFKNNLSARVSSPVGTAFDAAPRLNSFRSGLGFSVLDTEALLQLEHVPSAEYEQKGTNSSSYSSGFLANDYIYDYSLGLRKRFDRMELQADLKGGDHKGADAQFNGTFYSQTETRSHFLDHRFNLSYLSTEVPDPAPSALSRVTAPLLPERDLFVQAQAGYDNGRYNQGWTALSSVVSRQDTGFQRKQETRYWGSLKGAYGLLDNLEIESGLLLSSPIRVFSEWLNDPRTSPSRMSRNRYQTDSYLEIPLQLRYRPTENVETVFASPMTYARQQVAGTTRVTTGVETVLPDRELNYWNAKPRIEASWLLNPSSEGRGEYAERFEALTQKFLRKRETLARVSYERDVTHLDNDRQDGLVGFLKPQSLFDKSRQRHFFYGTEHSLRQDIAQVLHGDGYGVPNIQNDNRYEFSVSHGVTDDLNVSLLVGYRSSSASNVNVLPFTAVWETESHVVKPYYYFDFGADWKIRENMILSLGAHWVPDFDAVSRLSTDGGITTDVESDYLETFVEFTVLT